MTVVDAENIFSEIRQTSHKRLADQLFKAAVRYAQLRAEWALVDDDRRAEMDNERTAAHDAFIDCCNILSRAMANSGEDNGWRASVGADRKEIGDFACHIHCLLGLSAR